MFVPLPLLLILLSPVAIIRQTWLYISGNLDQGPSQSGYAQCGRTAARREPHPPIKTTPPGDM